MEYVKLSALVGQAITINEVKGFKWKMWLPGESRMNVSDTYLEGHRKLWQVDTNKGLVDFSSAQIGSMLEACMYAGEASLPGKTFEVKSNGKTGIDIRYYFNLVKNQEAATQILNDTPVPEYKGEADDSPF